MSKIGKRPIELPEGVTAKLEAGKILVTGPKGKMELATNPLVKIKVEEKNVVVSIDDLSNTKKKAMWGTMRSLINGMVEGVSKGFEKKLEVIGVGYRVTTDKKKINLHLGYSHPIDLEIPEGLEVTAVKNVITVSGINKQSVGQFASIIRSKRKPEPYKGKGVKYSNEVIRRKAGKVMKAAGA
ncbi:MAG: 50S ribosomal protein L6 [Candidatus Doudnabacteria bacterium CG10_big_fil_rev_8_21_14_0_10_41_10]|uniref:Large ribosomal subunit protein uL6 n=1 Tax=Candidatus Doudnabacteria bacterium CG10_big_fil_rev_8_21_14_0_10_41_10 TaxID=1974551 RepID=A0A2H0VDI8_9BACT|nr:MAG: 50S ribosomal protein L6 [Candidatus Doudnabacteria bacterium CG10_big_fil_rev_8_21_14_0_10_41_10]